MGFPHYFPKFDRMGKEKLITFFYIKNWISAPPTNENKFIMH